MTGAAVIEATGGAGNRAPSATATCPGCGEPFAPRDRRQRYCVPACQKRATRNAARGSRATADSPAAQREAETHRRRARLLVDDLYRRPPAQRPAFLETILRAAREHDWHLRRILTDRRAALAFAEHDHAGRPTLARTLDDWCQRTRGGARVWDVVAERWNDDATTIRLAAAYRDPWNDPDTFPDGPPEVHLRRDPAAFLANLRAMRAAQGTANDDPPSRPIRGDAGRAPEGALTLA